MDNSPVGLLTDQFAKLTDPEPVTQNGTNS